MMTNPSSFTGEWVELTKIGYGEIFVFNRQVCRVESVVPLPEGKLRCLVLSGRGPVLLGPREVALDFTTPVERIKFN